MNQETSGRKPRIMIPNSETKKCSFLFSTMFFLPVINGFLNEIFLVFGISSISTFVYFIIYALSLYIHFVALFQNHRKTAGPFILICAFVALMIVMHPEVWGNLFNFSEGLSSIALSNFFLLFFLGFPLLWIGLCLDGESIGIIQYYCERYSYFVVVLFIVTMVLQFGSSYTFNYMTIAYNAMPSLLIMMYCGFKEKRVVAKVFFIIGTVFILIGGCRGAILQLLVATILFFLVGGEKKFSHEKLMVSILVIILSVIFVLSLNSLMDSLGRGLQSLGFSSRLVEMYLGTSREGGLFHFDDRASVYETIAPTLSFWGKGIFVYPDVGYPHNIVLEFLLAFGYFIGVLLLLGLCVVVFKSYRKANHSNNCFLVIMWISAFTTIFVKLMFSASFLTDRPFWFYLAFMMLIIRAGRVRDND